MTIAWKKPIFEQELKQDLMTASDYVCIVSLPGSINFKCPDMKAKV